MSFGSDALETKMHAACLSLNVETFYNKLLSWFLSLGLILFTFLAEKFKFYCWCELSCYVMLLW